MTEIKFMDFYSDWCPPCKKQMPVIKELEQEYEEIDFKKIDVDEESDIAKDYGVSVIPTLVLECEEEEKDRFIGYTDKETLQNSLNEALNNC
ncbi:MAG: Thioredoxin [Candidatus Methanohalarchaeum thermophilum]|uniref:Thioredoxin n=1 Tax=Methanohalarchaeum thermophilum TaxID=1903181 RepID=A0A1Q6DUB9_METT1|nr:MAG: Thioredoxin [Candidatus Methanohalarchaeum thermophilum]